MAGSQDRDENPVAINVVPMVDVIFCLCVFFMCSFKFKQAEGTFDAWLPKDPGERVCLTERPFEEVRVALLFDEKTGATQRRFLSRSVPDDDQLQSLIGDAKRDYDRVHVPAPVTIDADSRVPWRDVVTVMNLAKRAGVDQVDFAYGAPTH